MLLIMDFSNPTLYSKEENIDTVLTNLLVSYFFNLSFIN